MDPRKMMSGQMRLGAKIDGARAEYNFMSLNDLICSAYKIKPYQLTGPDWMKTQRWDIQATMAEGAKPEQAPEMLQSLLKERFKLEIRRDTKDVAIYALVQGKNGSKMKEAEPEPPPPAAAAPEKAAEEEAKAEKDAKAPGAGSMTVNGEKMTVKQTSTGATFSGGGVGTGKVTMNNGQMHMEYSAMEMSKLADMLTAFVDRPVLDETQLKGKYQVALDLSMADMMSAARKSGMGGAMGGPPPGAAGGAPGAGARPAESASDPGASSSVFTAVEQMGLKLAPRKGPVEMIVVEKLEKSPTEN